MDAVQIKKTMSDISYYSEEGLKKLKSELLQLEQFERPRVTQEIADARDKGDLSENAEYHAAKEQQGLIEGRVLAINDLIARANVIDVTKIDNEGKVFEIWAL